MRRRLIIVGLPAFLAAIVAAGGDDALARFAGFVTVGEPTTRCDSCEALYPPALERCPCAEIESSAP